MILTIITVVYNDVHGLLLTSSSVRDALAELSDDRRKAIEYIVVDGGSSDGTLDKIKSNLDVISRFVSEADNGIYDAMNKGIKLAKGRWLYFLNAGDTLANKNVINNVFPNLDGRDAEVNFLYGRYIAGGIECNQFASLLYLVSHMLNHQSVIYSGSLFKTNLYDIRYRFCADYAHLLSVWPQLKSKALDLCIANFDTTGVSSQASNKSRMWKERLQAVWRSELNLGAKLMLSSRGIIMLPYHFFRLRFMSLR